MNKFNIVSYATLDTPYQDILNKTLKPSLIRFNLSWSLAEVPNLGSWQKNTSYKPRVLLDSFDANLRDACYVDADAEFIRYPTLFDELATRDDFDVACHYLDWNSHYGNGSNIRELLTGTFYYKKNRAVRELIEAWYVGSNTTTAWEQKVLDKLLTTTHRHIRVVELPASYCAIASLPDGRKPHTPVDPVILHYQASRTLKRTIR